MNKKILSLAVAAAMVAPGAAMAEAILYGKLNVSLDYANVKNVVLPNTSSRRCQRQRDPRRQRQPDPGQNCSRVRTSDGWGMSNGYIPGENRASRIGVKGSEDLGNGLKAIYQVELGVNLNDTNNNVLSNSDSITYRNTFIGLAGDWGTFLAGRHDTPMKISTGKLDLFSDTMADYNGTVGFRDLRADNVVAYISPSLAGFQLMGAIIPAGGATGGGQGLNLNEDSLAGAYSSRVSTATVLSTRPSPTSRSAISISIPKPSASPATTARSSRPVSRPRSERSLHLVLCLHG
jgi:predicted porin